MYIGSGDKMYSYLKGLVSEILADGITLEVGDVGYYIHCANPYQFKKNDLVCIYLYQLVKEDEISLYGFSSREDLSLFLKLISVKGLGCKMALPMFAASETKKIIASIENEDLVFLQKFPKIGLKLASQIILDLKGKLVSKNKSSDDLIETLKALGYKKSSIDQVVLEIDHLLPIELQIKEALKKL